jgi:subtilisin-like proprotein convertase family protein
LLICCLFVAASSSAFGQLTTNTFNFNNLNLAITDNDPNGVQNSQTVTGLSGSIANIQVRLDLEGTGDGAFNGDYYVELVNSAGGFAVLLNRVGMSSANPFGYGDDGFSVTFSDSAANDIHFYQNYSYSLNASGQLTGVWQPDGENISPLSNPAAFDAALSQQTALLSSFDGGNPNGTWTLFLTDLSAGGTGQLAGWSITVATVPEPAETSFFAMGMAVSIWFLRRQK